jgi:DNA polymerase-1
VRFPDLIPTIFKALDEGRVHDVQTREKLLDLARGTFRFEEDEDGIIRAKGYSLFDVAKRRLGRHLDKDTWRMRYHDLWDVPIDAWPKGAIDYAADDAIATLNIFDAQASLSKYLGNSTAQTRAHWALHLMSAWGFRTNAEAVDKLEARVRADIEEVRADLVTAGLVRVDGTRDTKKAIARMVEAMGPDCVLTSKGLDLVKRMEKTSDEIIREASTTGRFVSVSMDSTILSGDETLMAYSRYTQLRNLLTGSVKHLRTGTITPVQTRFEILMETGRTSSSGPNIQNLRRAPGVRECFVPRDGNVIIACDYAAAELHTLAQVCRDLFDRSALGDALNEGIDVHMWVGSFLMGIDYADAFALLKAGDPQAKSMRQLAKAANFGFPGGLGAKRFVGFAHGYGVKIDLKEAAKLKALWFRAWPEMRRYFAHISECVQDDGFYWVQQLRVERLRSRCTFTSACNSYFQGLAADGAKAAAYAVARAQFTEPDSPLFGTRSLAFVHDEILIEGPEKTAHAAAMELSRVMEKEFNNFVPDFPTTAEPTIMRYWSKKARQVWTDDGRLMPWSGDDAR